MSSSSSSFLPINHLKNALVDCLMDALSENLDIRKNAERRLKTMEITEGFAITLNEIALDRNMIAGVRQMSVVMLRQYIDTYWRDYEDEYLMSYESRRIIREKIMQGLGEPNSKIRNTFTYIISYIGSDDWPAAWPSLFQELNAHLVYDNENQVFGVIKTFEELAREADPEKTDDMTPHIIDQLCIIIEEDNFSTRVKMEAVSALTFVITVYGSRPQTFVFEIITPKLVPLCELYVAILQSPDTGICDYGLKTNIIKFLTVLLHKISKKFGPYLNMVLPTIWSLVMNYGELYTKSIVYDTFYMSEFEDGGGKLVGFTPLVLSIFDFIHSIVECPRINCVLIDVLPDIIYFDLIFMQITKKMEESWLNNPNCIAEDDSTDIFDTCVRVTAKDVLSMICHDFDEDVVIPAMCHALNRHLNEVAACKESGSESWWRIHEVCMFALGLVKDLIMSYYGKPILQFDLMTFIDNTMIAFQHPEWPLFLGRCLWFSGVYSHMLSTAQFNIFMQTNLLYLSSDQPTLRVFAIRTIIAHCEGLENNPNKPFFMIAIPNIFSGLIDNLVIEQYYLLFYKLCLQTVKLILRVNKSVAPTIVTPMIPVIHNMYVKHSADPDIFLEIRDLIKDICYDINSTNEVHIKLIPCIVNNLNARAEKVTQSQQTSAMDMLQSLLKCSEPPLSESMISFGFPSAVRCIIRADDQMLLESGGECIRCFLLLGAEQCCAYIDSDGNSGLDLILKATSHILDPLHSENGCKRVGRLVITIINKMGRILGSNIHFLLRALLSKMMRISKMSAWQSLLIVFIYLFYSELEAVISFLTSVPGPTGVSALEFVMVEWFKRVEFFTGIYDRNISVLALTKILEYIVVSEDDRLEVILVNDEYLVDENDEQHSEWSKIPMPVKAFKLVLTELQHRRSEEDNPEGSPMYMSPRFSHMEHESEDDETATLLSDFEQYNNDPDQYDSLFRQDPVFQIKIIDELTTFLHKFKTIRRFGWYTTFLNDKDKQILSSIGIYL